jgi:hypothetical protein
MASCVAAMALVGARPASHAAGPAAASCSGRAQLSFHRLGARARVIRAYRRRPHHPSSVPEVGTSPSFRVCSVNCLTGTVGFHVGWGRSGVAEERGRRARHSNPDFRLAAGERGALLA